MADIIASNIINGVTVPTRFKDNGDGTYSQQTNSSNGSNTAWSVPVAVNVGTLSVQIAPANSNRTSITITNDSANILYIGKDATVTSSGATKGRAVAASGGTFTTNYTGAIFGVYGTSSAYVSYLEDTNGAVSSAFNLLQLPGIFLWLDPTQQTGYNNNDLVGSLTDFTNHGNTATSSGGNRPTFKTNVQNGKPMINYLANSNYMQTAAFTALAQPNTIFFVAQSTNNTAGQVFFDSVTAGHRHYMDSPAGGGSFRMNAGSSASMGSGSAATMSYYTCLFNGASSQLWQNGVSVGTGDVGSNDLAGITLGGNNGPGAALTGYMGDFILAAGNQTASRTAVEAILKAKWGL